MWREQALLYLNTHEIDGDQSKMNVENEVGGWTNNRQTFWFNVNFRTLLGDLYANYDTFNMSFINCFSRVVIATGSPVNVNLYMSGVDFVNSGYDAKTKNNTTYAVIRNHFINNTANQTTITAGERDQFAVAFRKPINTVRLEFQLRSITKGEDVFSSATGNYPYFVLMFSIKPCVKPTLYEHNLNFVPARLFLSTPQISTSYSTPVVSNEIGAWGFSTPNGTARQTFSFNINMKTLLGDWWDKYDTFTLIFTRYDAIPQIPMGGGLPTVIYVSGLNFRNSYLQPGKTGSGKVPIYFNLLTQTDGASNAGDKNERKLAFKKGNANVKLEFELYNLQTLQRVDPLVAGIPLPSFYFQMLVAPLI